MAEEPGPGEKATAAGAAGAGAGLIAFGGFALFKDSHILEGGEFSLVHNDFGTGGTRVQIADGGVGFDCDDRWVVQTFWRGSSTRLDTVAKGQPDAKPPDPADKAAYAAAQTEAPFQALKDRVTEVANDLRTLTTSGDLLVVGSTDPVGYRGDTPTNEGLALSRARHVGDLLRDALSTAYPARHVLVANDKMTLQNPPPPGVRLPDPGPAGDHLARVLFGSKEHSGRAVLVCVMEPQPHGVVISGGGDGGKPGWAPALSGVAAGLMIALVLACAGGVFGLLAWRGWVERKKAKHDTAPASGGP